MRTRNVFATVRALAEIASTSRDDFTSAVVTAEDAWVVDGLHRNRLLDYAILKEAFANQSAITVVTMPSEPTIFLNKDWQRSPHVITLIKLGSTTEHPPCLNTACTSILKRVLRKCILCKEAVTTVAFDALDTSLHVVPLQSHVYGLHWNGTSLSAIEPTHNAAWHEQLAKVVTLLLQPLCSELNIEFAGVRRGLPFDHGDLCRYKVAFDCHPNPPATEHDFRQRVAAVVSAWEKR